MVKLYRYYSNYLSLYLSTPEELPGFARVERITSHIIV